MRRTYVAAVAAVLVIAALVGISVLRDPSAPERTQERTAAVGSPSMTLSPTAPGATATPIGTPTAAQATATARPTQMPAGRYVNADMGYTLELRPSWHRSTCGSSVSGGPVVGTNGTDLFIPIADSDFQLSHIGPFGGNADTIHVFAGANPDGLSPRDWRRMSFGGSSSEQLTDTTFLGRSALLVQEGSNESFVFGNAGYMWEVGHRLRMGSTALADRAAIVRSFRFLSADETRDARAAAATPSPAPRTPEQVVDVLADGFSKRDVTILARVIRPCFYKGVYQAGPESMIAEKYLEELRVRFAQGLVVEVRTRPISGETNTTLRIRSTWREPGQPTREADLTMSVHRGTTYWDGTITCAVGPCP